MNTCGRTVYVLVGCLMIWSWGASGALAQKAGWGVEPDPPTKGVEWPASLKLNIPHPGSLNEPLFPTQDSPFCVINLHSYESDKGELWNLATGKRVGAIQGKPSTSNMRALSSDGKYMAVAVLDRMRANDIEVWSLETGKKVSQFQADERNLSMTLLDFASPGEVLTYTFGQLNGKFVHHLRVWDATNGMAVRQMDLDKNLSGNDKYDISPGNRWLASLVSSEVQIYDLQTGRSKGSIAPPKKAADDHYVSAEAVRFSPDGKELALLCQGLGGSVLTVYDLATGDETLKHEMTAAMKASLQSPSSYKGPAIDFVAQPRGFLWYGSAFIERDSGMMPWVYKQAILEFNHAKRMLTPVGFVASTGGNDEKKIQVLDFPAAAMEKTLEAYRNDAPAIIKPGEKVQVKVTIGAVRYGKPDEAKKSIEEVLASRLADDGLEVDPSGNTVFTLKYKESEGKVLKEVKGGNIFGGGTPTGRTVQSTAADVEILWTTKDGKTKLYEHKFQLDPSHLMLRGNEQPTDAVIRQKVFDVLKVQLGGLPMPYFVPTDKSLVALPIETNSTTLAKAALTPGDAIKKKIDAKKAAIKKK